MMSVRGWVYVMSNQEAMPGLVKVGFSTKDPKLRARELSGTGVPFRHAVEYDVLVLDPRAVETQAHHRLAPKRANKEWFRCSSDEAIDVLDELTRGIRLYEPTRLNAPKVHSVPQSRKANPWDDAASFRPTGALWTFSRQTLLLEHKATGRTFHPRDYTYDSGGAIKGFALKNKETPWVRLEEVEFTD